MRNRTVYSGDLSVIFPVGIHQIEQVLQDAAGLSEALGDLYGVEVGGYDPEDVDPAGVPRVRAKADLDIFRFKTG